MNVHICLFLVLSVGHFSTKATPTLKKNYADVIETIELWELYDFIMKMCEELLDIDVEKLDETKMSKDIVSSLPDLFAPGSVLINERIDMYTMQFKVFAVKMIEIYEGSQISPTIKVDKSKTTEGLKKYLASEKKNKSIFSSLKVWKRLNPKRKQYKTLKACLAESVKKANELLTDDLHKRFRPLALFLHLRQKELRKFIYYKKEMYELDTYLLEGLYNAILNKDDKKGGGQDLLRAYMKMQDVNTKCFIDHMNAVNGNKWTIFLKGLRKHGPTIGKYIRSCVSTYYGHSEDDSKDSCVTVNNIINCAVCGSNKTLHIDAKEDGSGTTKMENVDLRQITKQP